MLRSGKFLPEDYPSDAGSKKGNRSVRWKTLDSKVSGNIYSHRDNIIYNLNHTIDLKNQKPKLESTRGNKIRASKIIQRL